MRVLSVALMMAFLVLPLRPATPVAVPFDPVALYGPELSFRVLRDGAEIGRHVVNFRPDGQALRVSARFDAVVRFLGIPVYRFDYRSEARWQEGRMQRIAASVNDDGTQRAIQAELHGDSVIVDGPKGLRQVTAPLWPSNHWHPGVLAERRVLNTLTGGIDTVRITPGTSEPVDTNAGPVTARRYVYSGDLHDVVAWYDAAGRWVRLRFLGKDGTPIDYVCEQCVRSEGK
ncbi:MAG: DUF6134 family protein [Pseudomonadota bacterium]|nr:DUF6134 family protein [Pseudomonadota bacterium]